MIPRSVNGFEIGKPTILYCSLRIPLFGPLALSEGLRTIKSDMSVAKHTDVLFVKQGDGGGNDLVTYRTKLGIRHIVFTDFPNALPTADQVVEFQRQEGRG